MKKTDMIRQSHKLPLIMEDCGDDTNGLFSLIKRPTITAAEEDEEIAAYGKIKDTLRSFSNTGIRGPQGKKGTNAEGIKFDSVWEFAYYTYKKQLKGEYIERNRTESLEYFSDGKVLRFYPDFKTLTGYVEIKGIWREKDLLKQQQHPEVEFIDGSGMKPIIDELNKKLPNWRKDYFTTD